MAIDPGYPGCKLPRLELKTEVGLRDSFELERNVLSWSLSLACACS